MFRFLILSIVLSYFILSSAQSVPFKLRKFKHQKFQFEQILIKLKRADQFYFDKHYDLALELYLDCQDFNPNNAVLNYKIGDIYLHHLDAKNAIEYFKKAFVLDRKIDKKLFTDLIFDVKPETSIFAKLGYSYALNFEWDQALKYYRLFKTTYSKNKELKYNFDDRYLKLFANQKVESCKSGKEFVNNPTDVKIIPLNAEVNTEFVEHSPFITPETLTLYFTARRKDGMGNNDEHSLDAYREDIYRAYYYEGNWVDVENIGPPVNTEHHDASVGVSFDGKTLFVYRFTVANGGDLFYSEMQEGDWTEPIPFGRTINTEFHESEACFSPDGRLMFFISDKPGGVGGRDIYYSKKLRTGGWGRAYNLGSKVNTPFDEHSIYMHPDGKTLYFSSKGHNSIGGYDIFKTTFKNRRWSTPINLGYPINTPGDDTHFVLTPDSKSAYYSSEKKNGAGANDIYKIIFPEEKKINNSVTIIRGRVRRGRNNKPADAQIEVINSTTSDTVGIYHTNKEDGTYMIPLENGNIYSIFINADSTIYYSESIDLTDESGALNFDKADQVITLSNIRIGSRMVLRNIFFESGKSHLLETSMPEFKKLVQFLNQYPKVKIIVIGHTDNVGNKEDNQKLSEERAKFLVDKLVKYGIEESRLTWKGYGMDKPVASNDKESGRRRNRRIEFKIVYK